MAVMAATLGDARQIELDRFIASRYIGCIMYAYVSASDGCERALYSNGTRIDSLDPAQSL